jgi:hypothetical protein
MTIPFNTSLPKRAKTCFLKNEELLPGMGYFSLLVDNDSDIYERQDYCVDCWNETFKNSLDKMLSKRHWKSKVPLKAKKEIPLNRDAQILTLLKELLVEQNSRNSEEIYVLTLFLARKRVMSLRKEIIQDDNSIVQLYEILDTEEMLMIKKIDLSTVQIGNIQIQIAKKLQPHGN